MLQTLVNVQRDTFFKTVAQFSPVGIIVADRKGSVLYLNPVAESLFDRTARSIVGRAFQFLRTGTEPQELEIEGPGKETRVVEIHVSEIRYDGEDLLIANLFDVTEHVRLREGMRTLSLVDELTGLYNRRGFLTLAQQQLKLANRTKRGMLLVFADLDRLKWINDSFGHREGDLALIEIASILKETFRESEQKVVLRRRKTDWPEQNKVDVVSN